MDKDGQDRDKITSRNFHRQIKYLPGMVIGSPQTKYL